MAACHSLHCLICSRDPTPTSILGLHVPAWQSAFCRAGEQLDGTAPLSPQHQIHKLFFPGAGLGPRQVPSGPTANTRWLIHHLLCARTMDDGHQVHNTIILIPFIPDIWADVILIPFVFPSGILMVTVIHYGVSQNCPCLETVEPSCPGPWLAPPITPIFTS